LRNSLPKGAPAKFLGYIEAPDEKAAIETAAKESKVADERGRSPAIYPVAAPPQV
jgi:hypothetical protein